MKTPLVSVIIATFNSSRTIAKTLQSIRSQSYPQKYIEILIVDGGSTDNTLKQAKQYKAKIIKNTNVEPVFAKYLGYKHAKGKYIMYVDHDEVVLNTDSILEKINVFQKNPEIKVAIASGYRSPRGYSIINR